MGFIYNNKSTDTILSVPLLIVSFDTVDVFTGVNREIQMGSQTISRQVANEYGVISTPALFEGYSLIKKDGSMFSPEEQITIERWLTSPKYSSDLTLFDNCTKQQISTYCGIFISTEWIAGANGYMGITFTFQANTPYPTKTYQHTYEINGEKTISLDCVTDDLNDFIYPTIIFEQTIGTSQSAQNFTFRILNKNENKAMNLIALDGLPIKIDCQKYMVTDATTSGVIRFSDLGWNDVGNIYWLRLRPGKNTLQVSGHGKLTIKYSSVYKKVGGWL